MSNRGPVPRYVYFVQTLGTGPIKIGTSVHPTTRMLQIGEWIPFKMELRATIPGGFGLEAALHNMFAADWSHGEWFHPSPRLLALIDDIRAGRPVAVVSNPDAFDAGRRSAIRTKKQWTGRINRAETKAWGNPTGYAHNVAVASRRPTHIAAIIKHYQSLPCTAPTPEQLAALEAYVAELGMSQEAA